MRLAAASVDQALTFLAHRLAACTLAQVFPLDVVARVAVRAHMMVGLLNRMPRRLPHDVQLLFGLDKSFGSNHGSEMPVSYHRDVDFLSSAAGIQ